MSKRGAPGSRLKAGAVAVGALLSTAAWAASAPSSDQSPIIALRHASNSAIAAHDSAKAVEAMLDETLIITSSGSLISGRSRMQAAFEKSFSDPQFIRYVRRPRRVSVSGAFAMERGVWEGKWTNRSLAGCYLTRWEWIENQWRIKAEMFVPADPRLCA